MLVKGNITLPTNSSTLNPSVAGLSVITDLNDVQFHIVKGRLLRRITSIIAISESIIRPVKANRFALPAS